jgi:hypothetical protein
MRLFRRLAIIVFTASLALAQAPAPSPTASADAASKDQVLKLIDMLHVRDQMKEVMGQLREQVHAGALDNLRARVPRPTHEQIAALNKSVDEQVDLMERKYSLDQMIDDIIPVYQQHLSKSDLEAILAFYSSPSGQKILTEMPAMMGETIQIASAHMQPVVEAALDNVDKSIQQLTADQPPAAKKKPAVTPKKPGASPPKPAPKP